MVEKERVKQGNKNIMDRRTNKQNPKNHETFISMYYLYVFMSSDRPTDKRNAPV